MNMHAIASSIEAYIRQSFQISSDDPGFCRSVDLFEAGYVDSVGVIELLAFVSDEFGVEVPDSALLSEQFATIDGMAEIIRDLVSAADSAPPGGTPTEAFGNLSASSGNDKHAHEEAIEANRSLEPAK